MLSQTPLLFEKCLALYTLVSLHSEMCVLNVTTYIPLRLKLLFAVIAFGPKVVGVNDLRMTSQVILIVADFAALEAFYSLVRRMFELHVMFQRPIAIVNSFAMNAFEDGVAVFNRVFLVRRCDIGVGYL